MTARAVVLVLALLCRAAVASAQCSVAVLVVYHSATGHTRQMADSVAAGARAVPGTRVTVASVEAVDSATLRAADAVIVGSPVHNANVSLPVLRFLDGWSFGAMRDKVGAAFVTAGGISAGEEATLASILRVMLEYQMIVVGGPDWSQGLGAYAVTAEAPFGSFAEQRLNPQFLTQAVALGGRVATVTRMLRCH